MFVKNKKTGLKWDVQGELLDRLKNDPDYEVDEYKKIKEVEEDNKTEQTTTAKKTTTRRKRKTTAEK